MGSTGLGATHTNGDMHGMNHNLQPMAEPSCAKKLKNAGVIAIVVSGVTLFGGLNLLGIPAMGGMGHFDHDIFAPLLLCVSRCSSSVAFLRLPVSSWLCHS